MFRAATEQDIDDVLEILAQTVPIMQQSGNQQWDNTYPDRARFEQDIRSQSLYLYCDDGRTLGFVCINNEEPSAYATADWQVPAPVMTLHRMAVLPDSRKAGIGAALVRFCETRARECGAAAIHTDTNSKNIPVNALFQKLGYRFTGKISLRDKPDLFNCYEKVL